MSSQHDITQQFLDGQVVPANLEGQDAASKTYVDEQFLQRDQEISDNATIMTDHINDNDVHINEVERNKLNSVQAGAEPNQNAFSQVNNIIANTETDKLTITNGTGISITTNPTTKTLTITASGEATPGAHGSSHNMDGSDPIPDLEDLRDDFDTLDNEFDTHLADLSHVHWLGTVSGTANALTATRVGLTLVAGLGLSFKANVDSTDATTLDINGLGPKEIKKANGNAVTNLKANGVYTVRYDGSAFILQGEGGEYGTATAADVLVGKTLGTESGVVEGLLVPGRPWAYITDATFTNTIGNMYCDVSGLAFQPNQVFLLPRNNANWRINFGGSYNNVGFGLAGGQYTGYGYFQNGNYMGRASLSISLATSSSCRINYVYERLSSVSYENYSDRPTNCDLLILGAGGG